MCMLPILDRELAEQPEQPEQFNFVFIGLNDIRGTIDQLSKGTLLDLTDCIFRTQTDNVRTTWLLTLQPQ